MYAGSLPVTKLVLVDLSELFVVLGSSAKATFVGQDVDGTLEAANGVCIRGHARRSSLVWRSFPLFLPLYSGRKWEANLGETPSS